jgi:hypothetical protein
MRLQINVQPAAIGIHTNPGRFRMTVEAAAIQINNRPADLQIHNAKSELRIDQEQVMSDIGLTAVNRLVLERSANALNTSNNGIRKIASEGNTMADIHINRRAIPQLAKPQPDRQELVYAQIPKHPPAIEFLQTRLSILTSIHRPDIQAQEGKPTVEWSPAVVDVYLKQKPKLDIIAAEPIVDKYL